MAWWDRDGKELECVKPVLDTTTSCLLIIIYSSLRDYNTATLQKYFLKLFHYFAGHAIGMTGQALFFFFYFLTLYYKKSVQSQRKEKIQTRSIFLFKQLQEEESNYHHPFLFEFLFFIHHPIRFLSVCVCVRLFCCQSLNEIPQSPNNSRIHQIIITVRYTQNTIDNESFLYIKPMPMPLQWNQ